MKGIPKRFEGKITEQQAKQLREVRDCPDRGCDGHLDRIEIWMHDDVVLEKYQHKGGSDHEDCMCDGGSQGLLGSVASADIIAQHYPSGRSKGHACLKGEV